MAKVAQSLRDLFKVTPNQIFGLGSIVLLISILLYIFFDSLYPLALFPAFLFLGYSALGIRGIFYFLIFCIPFSTELLIGTFGTDFPSELVMVFLLIVGLLYFIIHSKKINRPFFDHTLSKLLLFHYVWMGVAVIFSYMHGPSIKFFLAKTWYIFVFTYLCGHFIRTIDDVKKMLWILIIPISFLTFQVLLRHGFIYGFVFDKVNQTMGPFFRNHVNYAVFLIVLLPFVWCMRKWYPKGKIERFFLNCTFIIMLLGIFFSYTRTAWLCLLLLPVCYVLVEYKLIKASITAGLIGMSLFLAFMIHDNRYVAYAPDYNTTIYHADFSEHLSATFEMKDMSTMERLHRWVAGIKMSVVNPVTGFGPSTFFHQYKAYVSNMFSTYGSDNEEKSTVHNYFILVLVEQGFVGLFIFLILFIAIFIHGNRIYHQATDIETKQLVMAILMASLVLAAINFVSDLMEAAKLGPIFFINIALLINIDLNQQKKNNVVKTNHE